MSYQQLDFVADSYIPLLLLFSVVGLLKSLIKGRYRIALKDTLLLIIGVVFIYMLMFIDNKLKIWAALSLDYSTHTALALVFVCGISFWGKKQLVVVSVSMLFYCILMLYQQYHTLLDILTTGIAVLPVLFLLNIKLKRAVIS